MGWSLAHKRTIQWDQTEPLSLLPPEAPVHHAPIQAIAAASDAFTADSNGRVLRWTEAQPPTLWCDVGEPVVGLAASKERLAWVTGDRQLCVHVAPIDSPDARTHVATLPWDLPLHALRVSEAGELWLAVSRARKLVDDVPGSWNGKAVVALLELSAHALPDGLVAPAQLEIEAEGWHGRIAEAAAMPPGRMHPRCSIAVDGRLCARLGEHGKRRLGVPSADVERSTKLLDHCFGPEDDLIGLDLLRARMVRVGYTRDRARVLGEIEDATASQPRSRHVLAHASSPSQRRAAWVVHAEPGLWLVVADAERECVDQTELAAGVSVMAFWDEDTLLVSDVRSGLRRVRLGDTSEVSPMPAQQPEPIPRSQLWSRRASAWCSTATHAFFLDDRGVLLRLGLEHGELDELGRIEALASHRCSIGVFGDDAGEVLIRAGSDDQGWQAFDLATGTKLWSRRFAPEVTSHDGQPAYHTGRGSLQLLELRTGEAAALVEYSKEALDPTWTVRGRVLYDPAGRARYAVPFDALDHEVDTTPGGRWLVVERSDEVQVVRIMQEASEASEASEAPADPPSTAASTDVQPASEVGALVVRAHRAAPTDPHVVPVSPADAPVHHGGIVALAGGDPWAFSVDETGRMLRWTMDGGALEATHWRAADDSSWPDTELAVRDDRVAWTRRLGSDGARTAVFVADAADPASAQQIGTVPSLVHGIGLGADGHTVYVACAARFGVEHSAPADWPHPRDRVCTVAFERDESTGEHSPLPAGLDVEPHDPWRASFGHVDNRSFLTAITHLRIGEAGEIVCVGPRHGTTPKIEIADSTGKARTTKLVGHEHSPTADQLVALAPHKQAIVFTGSKSDAIKRSIEVADLAFEPKAPLVWASALGPDPTLYAVVLRVDYDDAQVVLANLEDGTARLVSAPELGLLDAPRLAFVGDRNLLLSPSAGLFHAAAEDLSASPVARPEPLGTPQAATWVALDRCGQARGPLHAWFLTEARHIVRVAFEDGAMSTLGVLDRLRPEDGDEHEIRSLGYVSDPRGDVLVLWGDADWLGYDVDSGERLWHRHHDDRPGELQAGWNQLAEDKYAGKRLVDARTGEHTGVLQDEAPPPRPGWRCANVLRARGLVVVDGQGRARLRLDPEVYGLFSYSCIVDPGGRSAVLTGPDGIAYVRFTTTA